MDQCHAGGHSPVHPHLEHRGVAFRAGHRLSDGQPLPARGSRPLHLSDHRLREDLDETGERDPGHRLRARGAGRPGAARPLVRGHGARRVGVVRSFTSRSDSLTAADSVRADSVKRARTDSLKQAGVTDSVKIDSIVSDTLKDTDRPWPQRPPAAPRVANKQGLNMFVWNLKYPDAVAFWGLVGVGTDGPVARPG